MATNLRLRAETESALRALSQETGRPQQEIIREALDRYLGLARESSARSTTAIEDLVARGILRPARGRPPVSIDRLRLPPGTASLDLLDRDDRI